RTKLERLERVFENARIIRNSEILKEYRSQLQSVIKSRKPVIRVEGYDISNIQGKHSVGSMVTFVHGQPDKNYYRKFNIKTVQGTNDTAMLREIVERRLNHTEWPFPDLIIVDGGKGQVNAVLKSLQERNIAIPVAGLVKDEKHFGMALILPKRKTPIKLSKLSLPDRNLLLSIDGEAHRFAIGHYRHRHGRSLK
ncbi:MAG TPA: excinuclease ABC subunit C, partial [Candidatus Paceibacterota bacterium]|nr:excinuclease ABC subunit C [Candidatus Paceibacterota bacterium]